MWSGVKVDMIRAEQQRAAQKDEYYQFIDDLNQGDQVKAKILRKISFLRVSSIEVMAARGPKHAH